MLSNTIALNSQETISVVLQRKAIIRLICTASAICAGTWSERTAISLNLRTQYVSTFAFFDSVYVCLRHE